MLFIRILVIVLLLIACPAVSDAAENPYWQEPTRAQADSLQRVLKLELSDSTRMYINRQLALYMQEIDRYAALTHCEEQLLLARKLNQPLWEAEALSRMAYIQSLLQNYSTALKNLLIAKTIASDPATEKSILNIYRFSENGNAHIARLTVLGSLNQHLGILFYFTKDFTGAMGYFSQCEKINRIINDNAFTSLYTFSMGEAFMGMHQLDSAEDRFNEALKYCELSGHEKYTGLIYYDIAKVYLAKSDYLRARNYYSLSVQKSLDQQSPDFLGMGYLALADLSILTGKTDSSLWYANKALDVYRIMNDTLGLIGSYLAKSVAYDKLGKTDSAYQYLKGSDLFKDSLNKEGRIKTFQNVGFSEQIRLQQMEADQIRDQSKVRIWTLVSGLILLLLISAVIYMNLRRQRRDKEKIERAYYQLEATQAQLIQSEKMASLGELTAGIAHEIQNPLNFVNNFSEVSAELIDEAAGSRQRAAENSPEVTELLTDIKQNLVKINHHGKRADAIVKGMLQHSQSRSGVKEPTDISALAEEYLRLSYHSFQSKNQNVEIEIKTDFDSSINKVNIVPQDIGKVLLNVLNNAFYAVHARALAAHAERNQNIETAQNRNTDAEPGRITSNTTENENQNESADSQPRLRRSPLSVAQLNNAETDDKLRRSSLSVEQMNTNTNDELRRSFLPVPYHPQVSISTKNKGNKIEITVTDNGTGIDPKIIHKIFQPFFTTKPTGRGTGLGLSLAYDIVKAHGGEIKVISVEGTGSEFTITLNSNS